MAGFSHVRENEIFALILTDRSLFRQVSSWRPRNTDFVDFVLEGFDFVIQQFKKLFFNALELLDADSILLLGGFREPMGAARPTRQSAPDSRFDTGLAADPLFRF